jgi:translation initiation factor 5B
MAPKKKGAKKAQDDWEADIGDVPEPIAPVTKEEKVEDVAQDGGDDDMGGGLLAALRKNRSKKQKKGKAVEDFVEGDDPAADNATPAVDLSSKAPIEATMDDEDVFGQPMKKEKPAKGKQKEEDVDDDEEKGADGKLLTKKEKEKLKKEREKQRKKEQVSFDPLFHMIVI